MQLVIGWVSTTGSHSCDFKSVNAFSTGNFEPTNSFSDFEFVNSFSPGYFMLVFPLASQPTNIDDFQLSQEESHHIWRTHDWDEHGWLIGTFFCRQR